MNQVDTTKNIVNTNKENYSIFKEEGRGRGGGEWALKTFAMWYIQNSELNGCFSKKIETYIHNVKQTESLYGRALDGRYGRGTPTGFGKRWKIGEKKQELDPYLEILLDVGILITNGDIGKGINSSKDAERENTITFQSELLQSVFHFLNVR